MSLSVRVVAPGLVAAVVASVLMPVPWASSAAAQDESDLARAHAQIAAIEDDIETASATADAAELDLAEARDALGRLEAIVNAVAQRVADQQDAVDRASRDLERLRREQEASREAMQAKAIQLYKWGGDSGLTSMVNAGDLRSAIDRSAFVRRVGEADQARIEQFDAAGQRTAAARDVLQAERTLLDGLLDEQQALLGEAEDLRDSRALAAATATERVDDLAGEHDELQGLEVEIERAIAERRAAEEAARREAAARAAEEEAAARAASQAAAEAEAAEVEAAEVDEAAPADDAPLASPSASSSAASGEDGGAESGGDSGANSTSSEPPPSSSGSGYAWPLCGPVTSEFAWRWGRQHQGLDIDDTRDRSISAAQSGTVIFAGYSGGYGNLVLVEHGDGVVTAYAHASSISVRSGQSVGRGQAIATVGSTGNSTGPHLHFETRVGGSNPVDPRQFLSGGGC